MNLIELGTILEVTKGKKPQVQSNEQKEGFFPYIDIKAFETGVVTSYTDGNKCTPCEEGDLLIVCDGSRSGLVGVAVKGYVGSTLAKISAKGVDNKYLYRYLQGKYTLLNTNKKGTGTPHLKIDLLRQQKILVPSLNEQMIILSRVETMLSKLGDGIETLKNTQQQLAIYRQAVLKDAFNACNETVALDSVCQHITDGDHLPPPKSSSGFPFIMISNIKNNHIEWSNTAFVNEDYFNNIDKKRKPQNGDVLYTVTGSYGIPIIIDFDKEFCFQRHIALLRPNEKIDQKYLYYALMSPSVYSQATKVATGTAQKTVGLTVLRKILIPFSSDKNLQMRIVSEIESKVSLCNNIEKTVDSALQESEALLQSILKQAFEGEYDVHKKTD